MSKKFDFSGWATRNNLRCSDGRTIRKDAFKENDGQTVPLVWQHQHDNPENVLGHALLENREEGVYAYCSFNNSRAGENAKLLVEHGDVTALSIYANQLTQKGGNVLHGAIKEVSLVLAGANPGALIDFPVLSHSGVECEDEAVIYTGEQLYLSHEDDADEVEEEIEEVETSESDDVDELDSIIDETAEELEHADEEGETMDKERTVKDVIDTFNEEQKKAFYYMISKALEEADKVEHSDNEGENDMKYNAFEDAQNTENTLSHSELETIFADAKRCGSLKDSVLSHSVEYGIENIEYLFPDAKTLTNAPTFIKRNDEWVDTLMKATHHTPFSRIKSIFADITEDDARAKGYIKGKMKKEEFFGLIKRTTTPTTIYKKQKLDRDDIIDITDFDVVAWLKTEMRMMLDEEIARAVLVGDGRPSSSDDKINPLNIRPIWQDDDLYTIKKSFTTGADDAKTFIKTAIKARKDYKGSGNPMLFTTEDMLTDMLLIEDGMGRVIYESVDKLATTLRVSKIVTVPVMEGLTRAGEDSKTNSLLGIIVNPADYNIGADKGGAINMFDDFDIDYNQQKYLIETRCSGALTKPYSAIVIESVSA